MVTVPSASLGLKVSFFLVRLLYKTSLGTGLSSWPDSCQAASWLGTAATARALILQLQVSATMLLYSSSKNWGETLTYSFCSSEGALG